MPGVQFDEDEDLVRHTLKNPVPRTAMDSLVKWGIAKTPNQASVVLLIVAGLLVFATIYFVRTSLLIESPKLGPDILKPGETVPSNRNI